MDTNECINDTLVKCKFVRPYGIASGGLHKDIWTEQELLEGIQIAQSMDIRDPRE